MDVRRLPEGVLIKILTKTEFVFKGLNPNICPKKQLSALGISRVGIDLMEESIDGRVLEELGALLKSLDLSPQVVYVLGKNSSTKEILDLISFKKMRIFEIHNDEVSFDTVFSHPLLKETSYLYISICTYKSNFCGKTVFKGLKKLKDLKMHFNNGESQVLARFLRELVKEFPANDSSFPLIRFELRGAVVNVQKELLPKGKLVWKDAKKQCLREIYMLTCPSFILLLTSDDLPHCHFVRIVPVRNRRYSLKKAVELYSGEKIDRRIFRHICEGITFNKKIVL